MIFLTYWCVFHLAYIIGYIKITFYTKVHQKNISTRIKQHFYRSLLHFNVNKYIFILSLINCARLITEYSQYFYFFVICEIFS
ncbi:hypothetical protein [Staphylococcus aureus]|uniref:hypothetical protein n=1 Tax=Staphylococcus aureus TaxID=1280 RepID=UPI00208E6572|nr:hypothetical protein [Staphylococcus aureus]